MLFAKSGITCANLRANIGMKSYDKDIENWIRAFGLSVEHLFFFQVFQYPMKPFHTFRWLVNGNNKIVNTFHEFGFSHFYTPLYKMGDKSRVKISPDLSS